MNKVTCVKNRDYQAISNAIFRDNKLSLKAKGLLALVLTLPDDWDFSIAGISAIVKEGKTAIYGAIDELKDNGYCSVNQLRNENGVIAGNDYTFYENPRLENPNTDNQPQQNNDNIIANTNISLSNEQSKDLKEEKSKKEDDEFVERMYKLYPTRCPVRNIYLGKCYKDKERIKRLLKTYSQEDIERVIKHEIDEKYGKSYMSNFSTFLNNFPDPSELFSNKSYGYPKDINDVKEEDVQHKLDFFNYWIEKKAPNVCDGLSNGRPQTEQQYKSLIEHTEGGARALCYVVLVLNRDGWEQYADERGFMWVYSNYIKANGLYKG